MLSHIHQPGLDFGHKLQLPSPMVNDWFNQKLGHSFFKNMVLTSVFFFIFFISKSSQSLTIFFVKLVEFTWEKKKNPNFFVKK
jgi:hypothetical protein